MATIPIRYLRVALGNTTPKASDRDVEVQRISIRYKRDENNQQTTEIDGVNLDYLGLKGCSQTVKLPITAKPSTDRVKELMADNMTIVRVKFINLQMKTYEMLRNGEIISGISATADDIEITSTEAPEVDDLIDFGN